MIQLKQRPAAPIVLSGKSARKTLENIERKINDEEEIFSDDFKPVWTYDSVKNKLYDHHNWKCCYCEQEREKKRDSDIEHFRPKTEIEGEGKPGYWWLAYDWDNLFISCKNCNQAYKGTQFPLLDPNRGDFNNGILAERPVLIDPEKEDPDDFIYFHWTSGQSEPLDIDFVELKGKDNEGRGLGTIRICGLNRDYLTKARGKLLRRLYMVSRTIHLAIERNDEELIAITEQIIKEETSARKAYTGFKRAYFRDQGLGGYISTDN